MQNQISLFSAGALLDASLSSAFKAKEVKNGKGEVVGATVALGSRKEMALEFNLKGKENKDALDAKILEAQDAGMQRVKGEIAGLGANWTLHKVTNRTVAGGIRQISLTVREIPRTKQISDEKIAAAWGIPVEEVAAFKAAAVERAAKANAETVDIAQNSDDDAAAVAKADAEYLAMEAAEAAKAEESK